MTKQEMLEAAARNRARLEQEETPVTSNFYQHDKPCRYCGSHTRYTGTNSCVRCVEIKLNKTIQEKHKNGF